MREHPLVKSIFGLIKFVFLLGLIVLGIVFMPDDFVARAKDRLSGIGQFFQTEAAGYWPAISHDFDQNWMLRWRSWVSGGNSSKKNFSRLLAIGLWNN